MKLSKIISTSFILVFAAAINGHAQQATASGDLGGAYPDPKVKALQGMPISIKAPSPGQVLKWNGNAWEPAAENAAATSQSPPAAKPSVLFFNQLVFLAMTVPNINTLPIPGLDNKTFTLAQSSRVVFRTIIAVKNEGTDILSAPVAVWVTVEIQNASGGMVARASSGAAVARDQRQTIIAEGTGVLPAGTYRMSVMMSRKPGGSEIRVLDTSGSGPSHQFQGGQTIIEIIPD